MDEREIAAAPELFMFRLPPRASDYPLIERFREGVDRDVLVERARYLPGPAAVRHPVTAVTAVASTLRWFGNCAG